MQWTAIIEGAQFFSQGLTVTLKLIAYSACFGGILSFILALLRYYKVPIWGACARVYSAITRGIPVIVWLFLFYYGLGNLEFIQDSTPLWWIFQDGFRTAILVFSLNIAAYFSEVWLGGLRSVPIGMLEAGQSCGFSRVQILRRIHLPLAIRQALPIFSNELILLSKSTSLASTITVMEITGYAKRLMSQTFAIFEVFIASALLYLAINFTIFAAMRLWEFYLMIPYRR
ncbi:ABC transporter permease [Bartonella sp. DGB2]|uniref:ABC transporter permease n=1 Tax=Bartonella sp. DGB2 TaxID=3388426 RepID=UPI00398FB77E